MIQFFFFEIIKERVKNTRTNERKSSFLLKKKRKKRSQSSSLELFLIKSLCVSLSLSRARVRERKRESNVGRRVRRRDRCVALFLSRRLSGGAVLVSKAFESQVLTLFLFFFFPSLLTDSRRTRKERRTKECRRGQWDGRKSASNALKTNEIDR